MTLKESRARKFIPKRRKQRRGPMRCKAYRDWCKQKACAISGVSEGEWYQYFPLKHASWRAIIDAAHTRNNGMSSKGPDSSCVPLERALHIEYDAGRKAFEKKYGFDMQALAAEYWKRFCEETGRTETV